ncbi:hypothetical protein PL9214490084 [Planktothrix tepida PCC 9214]|uniref:Uncharacterized protein n=1 Tax=Planktothrix tepida PCC 9214 TaxID=671072 RepID=A0A1J1LLP3_9CYAN|nr:hypothetical protein PL9214490084 [Planktothrix tepida PCC 9214]
MLYSSGANYSQKLALFEVSLSIHKIQGGFMAEELTDCSYHPESQCQKLKIQVIRGR